MKRHLWLVVLIGLLSSPFAYAKNFPLRGQNELCGGIGVAGDMSARAPGGFKWFNDFSHQMNQLTWLNFQFNVTLGGRGRIKYDRNGRPYDYQWNGQALEFAGGVKLKWRLRQIPLQFHAKIGGALDIVFLSQDVSGIAFGVRGGFGVRYFFVPTFGVGAELIPTFGPAILSQPAGTGFYGTIDFNTGVEWRF